MDIKGNVNSDGREGSKQKHDKGVVDHLTLLCLYLLVKHAVLTDSGPIIKSILRPLASSIGIVEERRIQRSTEREREWGRKGVELKGFDGRGSPNLWLLVEKIVICVCNDSCCLMSWWYYPRHLCKRKWAVYLYTYVLYFVWSICITRGYVLSKTDSFRLI